MNQPDATAMMEKLEGLYKEWNPSDAVIRQWRSLFYRIGRAEAGRAIDELWNHAKSPRDREKPNQGAFNEILVGYRKATHGERRPDPTTDTYIICIEAPKAVPRRLGWFRPVFLGPLHEQHSPERVHAAAERMRADHEGYYRGEWTTIQGASFEEMATLRAQIRVDGGLTAQTTAPR